MFGGGGDCRSFIGREKPTFGGGDCSSSFGCGGGDDTKSSVGYTPGGLSRDSIDSSWLESPTTSAHP